MQPIPRRRQARKSDMSDLRAAAGNDVANSIGFELLREGPLLLNVLPFAIPRSRLDSLAWTPAAREFSLRREPLLTLRRSAEFRGCRKRGASRVTGTPTCDKRCSLSKVGWLRCPPAGAKSGRGTWTAKMHSFAVTWRAWDSSHSARADDPPAHHPYLYTLTPQKRGPLRLPCRWATGILH